MRHKGGGDTPWTVGGDELSFNCFTNCWHALGCFTDLFIQTGESRKKRRCWLKKQEDETEKDRRTRRLQVHLPAAQKH